MVLHTPGIISIVIQQLDRELLLTLCYTTQFGYPLTVGEVLLRRISQSPGRISKNWFDLPQEVIESIERLIDAGVVRYLGGYLFLCGKEGSIAGRMRKKATSTAKFKELEPLINFLRKLPGIAGVAVTGSAAVFNANADDDVDLLIVTENHRLWLVRPLVVFFAFIHGKRRTWYREEKNSWCFNLWLERRSLVQDKKSHSLYVAYEVCQAKWLLDVAGCKLSFLLQNAWVSRYLPAYYSWCKNQHVVYEVANHSAALSYWPIISELAGAINYILYGVQRLYMHAHMTRERVGASFAFFHPRDTGSIITRQYHDIVYGLMPRTILATGVFDILHQEHFNFLQKAKALGGRLFVGIESDVRVRQLKGNGRPVNSQQVRLKNLLALGIADEAFVLPERFGNPEDHLALLEKVKPSILAVSSHSLHLEKKEALMKRIGGKVVVVHQHNPAISTSIILEQQAHQK